MRPEPRTLTCQRCQSKYVLEPSEKLPGLCESCYATFKATRYAATRPLSHWTGSLWMKYDHTDRRVRKWIAQGGKYTVEYFGPFEMDSMHRTILEIDAQTQKYHEDIAKSRAMLQTWYDKWPILEIW